MEMNKWAMDLNAEPATGRSARQPGSKEWKEHMKPALMYVQNKDGNIDGVSARMGWVTFSKTGRTLYYRGRSLKLTDEASGDCLEIESGDEYRVSSVKKRGSNSPFAEPFDMQVDDDALEEYSRIKSRKPQV